MCHHNEETWRFPDVPWEMRQTELLFLISQVSLLIVCQVEFIYVTIWSPYMILHTLIVFAWTPHIFLVQNMADKNITARNEKKILLLLFVKNNYCTSKMLYRRNYKSSKKIHFFSSVMCMLQYTLHALYYCLHQKCFCKINMVLHSSAQTFWT